MTEETVVTTSLSESLMKISEATRTILIGLISIILGIILIMIFEILRGIGMPMQMMLVPVYPILCGLICLFSKKHVGRRILIMTLAIVVIGIILSVNSYAVGI